MVRKINLFVEGELNIISTKAFLHYSILQCDVKHFEFFAQELRPLNTKMSCVDLNYNTRMIKLSCDSYGVTDTTGRP